MPSMDSSACRVSILETMPMPVFLRCFLRVITSDGSRTKESATRSTPFEIPNLRSAWSFLVSVGTRALEDGKLTLVRSYMVPPRVTRHLRLPLPADSTLRDMP